MDIRPLGDQAVRIEFGQEISPEVHRRVRRFCRGLAGNPPDGVTEWVPAYTTVAVHYQAHRVRYGELCAQLAALAEQDTEAALPPPSVTEIPVCYGGADGPDLGYVASYHGRTPDEIVALHTQPTYLIYLLGFLPGFPYLGGLPPGLATPRRPTPRTRVPAGSVGIAGAQTGVYPFATPGGWQIIGRTPLVLYDVGREPPALLRAGDYVKFVPVTREEAAEIACRVGQGDYEPHRYAFAD